MSNEINIDEIRDAAMKLDRVLVYEAGVRMLANATTGRFAKDTPSNLLAHDMLLRWAERQGGEFYPHAPVEAERNNLGEVSYWHALGSVIAELVAMKRNLDNTQARSTQIIQGARAIAPILRDKLTGTGDGPKGCDWCLADVFSGEPHVPGHECEGVIKFLEILR